MKGVIIYSRFTALLNNSVSIDKMSSKKEVKPRASAIDLKKTELILQKFNNKKDSLISILLEIQDEYGYLPRDSLMRVAEKLEISLIDLCGVASFYKVFRFTPKGKHLITVCLGTACHVRGGPRIVEKVEDFLRIKTGETTTDGKFTFETVRCLGACALGPIMVVDGNYHGNMTQKKVDGVLKNYS